jgi:hypothetical protein
MESDVDWDQVIQATHLHSAILFALRRDDEAKLALDRIATIEETYCE